MNQLKLSPDDLIEIGFEKHIYPKGTDNKEKITYEIPCINGCFYCNMEDSVYVWYQKIIIGDMFNFINLDINRIEELLLILSCFKVKFNFKYLINKNYESINRQNYRST